MKTSQFKVAPLIGKAGEKARKIFDNTHHINLYILYYLVAKKALLNKDIVKNNENFTPDQILDLFDAFQSFVDPRTKLLNIESLISCATTLGLDKKNPTIINLLDHIKAKGEEELELTFEIFMGELGKKLGNVRSTEGRNSLFQLIDEQEKEYITFDDLKSLAKEVGHVISDDDLREIVENMSKTGNISFEEFEKYLSRKIADK